MDDPLMQQSASERTPLVTGAASRPSGVGNIYRGIPGVNIEDGPPASSSSSSSRGAFAGQPTARERVWYKAKQFKSLLVSLSVCSLIAILIIVAVVASHHNGNKAFPAEANNPAIISNNNDSGKSMLTSSAAAGVDGRPSIVLMASNDHLGAHGSNQQLFPSAGDWNLNASKVWILKNNVSQQDLMQALDIGRQSADRLRDMASNRHYKPPSLSDAGLKPDDLYRAAKTGFDETKLRNYTGYAVDAASSHLVNYLGLTKEQAMDPEFWNVMPSVGLLLAGAGGNLNRTFIPAVNMTDADSLSNDTSTTTTTKHVIATVKNVTEDVASDIKNATKNVINRVTGKDIFNTTADAAAAGWDTSRGNATTYWGYIYGVGSTFNCSANETYRRIDGLCNNLEHPWWGAAGQAYRRLLAPDYDDGVSLPRETSSDGVTPLPGARTVSRVLHRSDYREEPGVSMLFVMWGQFLDHDMEASVNLPGGIDCCANLQGINIAPNKNQTGPYLVANQTDSPVDFATNQTNLADVTTNQTNMADLTANPNRGNLNTINQTTWNTDMVHPECFPILIDNQDSFYGPKNMTCMNLVRDAVAPSDRLGPRQQMNANTAFIDASMVYGSSELELRRVRGNATNGTLASMQLKDGRNMMPMTSLEGCSTDTTPSAVPRCHFGAGDSRAEENMGLTSFHTLFFREHNRIATALSKLNPSWNHERLFQEARRIVIAEIQHITDTEYLPVLLGNNWEDQTARRIGRGGGFFSAGRAAGGYQEDLDPSISNVFAGAAYRFGHSMVQGLVKTLMEGQTVNSEDNIPLHEMQFNTSRMYGPGEMDALIRGYSREPSRRTDRFFTSQVTNHLFETRDSGYGLDLVSINIQRGRDRGLPSYNAWREYCGLPKLSDFSDLDTIADKDSAKKFRSVYRSVDDIDAYTGLVAERRAERSLIGPTLRCLLSEQFYRLKHGDRFWYDSQASPNPFTDAQLAEIRKSSLATVICRNSDSMKQISPSPMVLTPGSRSGWSGQGTGRGTTAKVFCNSLPTSQLVAWEQFNLTAPAVLTLG